jgi:hypothetical protein
MFTLCLSYLPSLLTVGPLHVLLIAHILEYHPMFPDDTDVRFFGDSVD